MSHASMNVVLAALRACAEPTRLRLLALAARGAFCVSELTEILGQSQPRLSRHLRLLCDAGVLERVREGANVWFGLPPEAALVRDILAHMPEEDPVLASDRRAATRVLAERARVASESFRRQGADWDEMRALDLPAEDVEAAVLAMLPGRLGRVLDIGTGTGRMLEVLASRVHSALGVDASRAMLALARTRLARTGLGHVSVRQADMYRLPLAGGFDVVLLQMVLHHAEDPGAVLAEAARMLAPGGRLIVVDLAACDRAASAPPLPNPLPTPLANPLAAPLAVRWPGFTDQAMRDLLAGAGVVPGIAASVPGPLDVRLWPAALPARSPALVTAELVTQDA